MLHLLIGIVALVWTLVGLWLLRRMWAISAAERRERKLERREQQAWQREQTPSPPEKPRLSAVAIVAAYALPVTALCLPAIWAMLRH